MILRETGRDNSRILQCTVTTARGWSCIQRGALSLTGTSPLQPKLSQGTPKLRHTRAVQRQACCVCWTSAK